MTFTDMKNTKHVKYSLNLGQFCLHNKDIIIPYFIKVFTLMGDKFKKNPEDEDYELPLL